MAEQNAAAAAAAPGSASTATPQQDEAAKAGFQKMKNLAINFKKAKEEAEKRVKELESEKTEFENQQRVLVQKSDEAEAKTQALENKLGETNKV